MDDHTSILHRLVALAVAAVTGLAATCLMALAVEDLTDRDWKLRVADRPRGRL